MFQKKVIVITGGAGGIGKCIAEEFQKQGAYVCIIDCVEGDHYVGDIADKETLEDFAQTVIEKYGKVDVLVNNAPPGFHGIDECTYEQFQQAMAIGVTAPFYLSKLFVPYFAEGASIINISCQIRGEDLLSECRWHRAHHARQGDRECVPRGYGASVSRPRGCSCERTEAYGERVFSIIISSFYVGDDAHIVPLLVT